MAAATSNQYNTLNSVAVAALDLPVAASTHIYKGTFVATNASGYVIALADSASIVFAGLANEESDNSAGANGDKTISVEPPEALGFVSAKASGATQAWVTQPAHAVDNVTVAISGTTNAIVVGKVVKVLSSTEVIVAPLR